MSLIKLPIQQFTGSDAILMSDVLNQTMTQDSAAGNSLKIKVRNSSSLSSLFQTVPPFLSLKFTCATPLAYQPVVVGLMRVMAVVWFEKERNSEDGKS